MFRVLLSCFRDARAWFIALLTLPLFAFFVAPDIHAQGASNEFGNGGRNTIQGRLYLPDSRRSDVSGLTIRLKSSSGSDITIISDDTGTFIFRGLSGGSYTITVEGGGIFENATEYVVIDDLGSSSMRNVLRVRSTPHTANVQIFLKPLASARTSQVPGVLNVKWTNVPRKALDHFDQGLKLIREGKDSEAEAELKRTIEIAPNFAPAYTALGRIAQRAGKLDAAMDNWSTALRFDQADFDAHLNLGIAYLNLRKLADAESELVSAAFLDRTAVTPHYYLGILFVVKDDLTVAQKAFETAKQLDGGRTLPAIHKYLGRIYSTRDMEKDAIKELETYLNLAPSAPDAAKVRQDIADIKSKQN